ncbi:UNVERIFIED_CONTAM: hypothetical protein GTU68_013630 [Idotea baltica]|nr:hypothetical protein [Idotea baltica]
MRCMILIRYSAGSRVTSGWPRSLQAWGSVIRGLCSRCTSLSILVLAAKSPGTPTTPFCGPSLSRSSASGSQSTTPRLPMAACGPFRVGTRSRSSRDSCATVTRPPPKYSTTRRIRSSGPFLSRSSAARWCSCTVRSPIGATSTSRTSPVRRTRCTLSTAPPTGTNEIGCSAPTWPSRVSNAPSSSEPMVIGWWGWPLAPQFRRGRRPSSSHSVGQRHRAAPGHQVATTTPEADVGATPDHRGR